MDGGHYCHDTQNIKWIHCLSVSPWIPVVPGSLLPSCQGLEGRCCLKAKNYFEQVAFLIVCGVCNLRYSLAVAVSWVIDEFRAIGVITALFCEEPKLPGHWPHRAQNPKVGVSVNPGWPVEGDGCPTTDGKSVCHLWELKSDSKCYLILSGNYLSISCVSILYWDLLRCRL